MSQHTNTKLRDIARAMADLVTGGQAPGLSSEARAVVMHGLWPRDGVEQDDADVHQVTGPDGSRRA